MRLTSLTPTETLSWYALYTRSRCEKKVSTALTRKGFEVFLPLRTEKRKWSDRIKTVSTPLIPGYIFVKTEVDNLGKTLYCPGIVRVVSFCGKPCKVKDSEISLLETIVKHGLPTSSTASCCIGDRVKIVRGALKGWEGIVERTQGSNKVTFVMEGIGQAVCVEIGMEEVEKLK